MQTVSRCNLVRNVLIFCSLLAANLGAKDSCLLENSNDISKLLDFLNFVENLVQGANDGDAEGQGQARVGGNEATNTCQQNPMDCEEILQCGYNISGVYKIWPRSRIISGSVDVYCDMSTDGGGWMVFQRRGEYGRFKDYFFKEWSAYKTGFGNIREDFWLGNDVLFAITNQRMYSLRIDMMDLESDSRYASYDHFWIEAEDKNYTLHVDGYKGNAGDSLTFHSDSQFSTKDRDNDRHPTTHCSQLRKGGWWYKNCIFANLNGIYLNGTYTGQEEGISWKTWRGFHYSLPFVEMKMRSFSFPLLTQRMFRKT
uniref:U11-Liphistoxin-Lth1b_1 n=1 Tax=Liphistius thaleban TaxID=1905330 RepID=A0A4V2H8Q9_9ARAC